jgi:DNA topoisomerase-1
MIKAVAEQLGNTREVCRKYYIHPIIAEAYAEGKLLPLIEKCRSAADASDGLFPEERAVMALLRQRR